MNKLSPWAIFLIVAGMLSCACPVRAESATAVPVVPIGITSCGISGWPAYLSTAMSAGHMKIAFVNHGVKIARKVVFDIHEGAISRGQWTDVGTFSANVPISTTFQIPDDGPIGDPKGLTCSVLAVTYDDGSRWEAKNAVYVVEKQPDAPAMIRRCVVSHFIANDPYHNLLVYLSFRDTTGQVLTAVKFRFTFFDAFNAKIGEAFGIVSGTFSPGVIIKPAHVGTTFEDSPNSPAWRYFFGPEPTKNSAGTMLPADIARSSCSIAEARFADGTIWKVAAP